MTATAALRSGQQSALWPKGAAVLLSIALSWPVAPARAGSFDADDATGKELISHLDSDNWKYRIEALEEIGDRGLIQAVDKVVQLARSDEHHKVRHDALEVLEEVESSWLLPTAEFMVVEDPVEHNRKDALEVLHERGEGSRTAMVLGKVILGDHLSDLRERAARVLRKKKWTGAEEALARAALRDGESDVRRECRRALVIVGGEKYRPVLHRILMDEPNNKLRLELAKLIAKAPLAADRAALLETLDDPYGKVAIVAAKALVKLGDRSVAKTLRDKALETTDRSVAEEFNEAAEALGG